MLAQVKVHQPSDILAYCITVRRSFRHCSPQVELGMRRIKAARYDFPPPTRCVDVLLEDENVIY